MKFYTADFHLNSSGIIKWIKRPFKNAQHMNRYLIHECNNSAKSKTDVIYHIGDFCNTGCEKGFETLRINPKVHIEEIQATLILLQGNHDGNNKVKSHMNYCFTDIGNLYHNVSIGHFPSYTEDAKGQFLPHTIRLCGHVHKAYKWTLDKTNDVLNINMGVDVWRYHIVSETDLIRYLDFLTRRSELISFRPTSLLNAN